MSGEKKKLFFVRFSVVASASDSTQGGLGDCSCHEAGVFREKKKRQEKRSNAVS